MKAIEVAETGGPEVLTHVDKDKPSPGSGEVVINLAPHCGGCG